MTLLNHHCNFSVFSLRTLLGEKKTNQEVAGNRSPPKNEAELFLFVHERARFRRSAVNRNDMVSPWVHTVLLRDITPELV